MIHTKDHKQLDMFNPFAHLGPKRLALLESSWAHLFREEILHRLPVEKLFSEFDEFRGRKTKELYAMLGLVLIQQMEDCTDTDAVDNFALNLKWQYALNITDATDVASYVSPRTLWNIRDIVARHGLQDSLFLNVTDALKKLFSLDPSKQRLDSVHIFSNMAHLGRIRLFVRTIRTFLINVKRHHPQSCMLVLEMSPSGTSRSMMAPLPSNRLNRQKSSPSLVMTVSCWSSGSRTIQQYLPWPATSILFGCSVSNALLRQMTTTAQK